MAGVSLLRWSFDYAVQATLEREITLPQSSDFLVLEFQECAPITGSGSIL